MTRAEAAKVVVLLSVAYGGWTEMRKELFADSIEDLPYDLAERAARDWVKTQPGRSWPAPGDIRQMVMRAIERRQQKQLTDERESGRPVEPGEGLRLLREMRAKLELKGGARRAGPQSVGEMLGRR